MGVFTGDRVKATLDSISSMFDNFMGFIVGVFTGKWEFAANSVSMMFNDLSLTIANALLSAIQPFLDIFNLISGSKINIGSVDDIISKLDRAYINFNNKISDIVMGKNPFTQTPVNFGANAGITEQRNINTEINLTLPNNPTTEQINSVSSNVEAAVEKALQRASRSVVNAMPIQE